MATRVKPKRKAARKATRKAPLTRASARLAVRKGPPVAVLFVHWRRPDLVRQTLPPVLAANPPVLYLSQDAPRTKADRERWAESRSVALALAGASKVPVVELSPSEWQGCRRHVHGAIGRALDAERRRLGTDQASLLVVEDDVQCAPEFFAWAAGELAAHAADPSVMSVASGPVAPGQLQIWGWGTWWDRWQGVKTRPSLDKIGRSPFADLLRWCAEVNADDWVPGWQWAHMQRGARAVAPPRSLVRNLGVNHPGRALA